MVVVVPENTSLRFVPDEISDKQVSDSALGIKLNNTRD